jgi:hypothetical protein
MKKRTVIRTILDILLNNTLVKTIVAVVNFCKEQQYYRNHELKFLKNMPINKKNKEIYKKEFLFTTPKL